jgi:gliding motility-associated-like protein
MWPGIASDTLALVQVASGSPMVSYIDNTALSGEQSYTYKYVFYNKCDSVAGISNSGRTILLEGIADDGFVNKLWWNTYGEWDAQVFDYTVYRAFDTNGAFQLLQNTVTDTTFVDRVADEVDRNLTFCYVVKAYEGPGNAYGVRESSWSNVLCLQQEATIYFPTAFTPGQPGINAVYKPQGLYETLAKNLKFTIYNRWGNQVYSGDQAWDGKDAPSDVYYYIVVYRQAGVDTDLRASGQLTLLR